MQQIADFHIHSRYSRACSRDLTLENIDKICRVKGVDIIGTGDFTFPDWFSSIKNELEDIGGVKKQAGLYKLKTVPDKKVKFILTTELALIYKKNDPVKRDGASKCRRIHMVLHAPNIEAVEELNNYLDKNYNIRSDGRPILGMSIEALCKICFAINPKFLIYPAHIWTPWFAIFGSKSGFDSWDEAFGEYADKIFAYETGLSSDPEMNWRVSELDKFTVLSNSDAHSLPNLAREANVFNLKKIDYDEIYDAIKNKKNKKSYLDYTIEFYPEEGMYHYDGHRACGVRFTPEETKKHKGICPKCKKPVVVGVDYRVGELADRTKGFKLKGAPGFKKLVGLEKIIAEVLGIKSRKAKKVQMEYNSITNALGPELDILLKEPIENIGKVTSARIAEGIKRVRAGNLFIEPGFDGQYGIVKIFSEEEKSKQGKLF
ncbi:DNA helicase UvrD [Candidatus Parcubacteria bacterium]|nr:DNA helicase UvrD [Candidatus Parcubacteria bacterium]